VVDEQEVWPVPHKYNSHDTNMLKLPQALRDEIEEFVTEYHARCEAIADAKEHPEHELPW
jgi:hypothetical protein